MLSVLKKVEVGDDERKKGSEKVEERKQDRAKDQKVEER